MIQPKKKVFDTDLLPEKPNQLQIIEIQVIKSIVSRPERTKTVKYTFKMIILKSNRLIISEFERMKEIKHKGVRMFTDEYIISALSLRFAKSEKKIKEILNL